MAEGNLTLADFTYPEVKALYFQHTKATGQVFLDAAIKRAFYWSEGRPLLVNALASEAIEEILSGDYRPKITAKIIDRAADNLVKKRRAYIDAYTLRLHLLN
jgi:hypothetical protein